MQKVRMKMLPRMTHSNLQKRGHTRVPIKVDVGSSAQSKKPDTDRRMRNQFKTTRKSKCSYLKLYEGHSELSAGFVLACIYSKKFSICKLHSQAGTSFTRGKTNHSQWQLVLTHFHTKTAKRANGNCKPGVKQLSLNVL